MSCGCNEPDSELRASLIAGLTDDAESIRLAALEAIADALARGPCPYCHQTPCASEAILSQLEKRSSDREPSLRVRRAAAETLALCRRVRSQGRTPARLSQSAAADQVLATGAECRAEPTPDVSPRRLAELFEHATVATLISDRHASPRAGHEPDQRGAIVQVDYRRRTASVRFLADDDVRPEPGTKLRVYRPDEDGYSLLGELEVLESSGSRARVRPTGKFTLSQIKPGVLIVVPERQ